MDIEDKLYFEGNKYEGNKCKDWEPLPYWGEFFIDLGYKIAQKEQEDERFLIGVVVPTRAYIAALISFGIVLGRANNSQVTLQEHFKNLCKLPKNTPITFQEDSKIYKGYFLGYEQKHGENGVWIKLEKKSSRWIPFNRSNNIEKAFIENPTMTDTVSMLPKRQSGKSIRFAHDFVANLVGEENVRSFFNSTTFDCAILGRTNTLRNELNTPFSIISKGKFAEGVLQDILRVRKFMGQREAYHTNIFRMDSSKPPRSPVTSPHVTIFDGAIGFLKWRDFWKTSHRIAIFDRTEPNFDYAVTTFNQEYIKNHTTNSKTIDLYFIPPGCEVMIYTEDNQ